MNLDLLQNDPLTYIAFAIAIVFAIGFHEFSHVFVAYSLGDRTGKQAGRLTLNPLKHLDPLGTLLILMGAMIGWGKPAPFNPDNLRYRRYGSAVVALGGPISNIFFFFLCSLVLHWAFPVYGPTNLFVIFLAALTLVNASLALFNLIPLPPLDGSWLLLSILPRSADRLRVLLQAYGQMALLGVIVLDFVLRIPIVSPWMFRGIEWLVGVAGIGPYLGSI